MRRTEVVENVIVSVVVPIIVTVLMLAILGRIQIDCAEQRPHAGEVWTRVDRDPFITKPLRDSVVEVRYKGVEEWVKYVDLQTGEEIVTNGFREGKRQKEAK